MNKNLRFALAAAAVLVATNATAEVIFYEHDDFQGRSFSANNQVSNFQQYGFNDRASSVMVIRDRWEVCEDAQFGGRCIVLRPGRYPSLSSMNLNDRISSVRNVGRTARIDDDRYAPPSYPVYDNRRRGNERTYEANVTSVRAVMGAPERRCWVERERVTDYQNNNNVPGAIVGAIIGGVLGHQVGGGRGKDVATALGAVTGAAVGNSAGGDSDSKRSYSQGVRRCENDNYGSSGRPEYWDVTYIYRGQEHRVQMTYPPGPTITVNRQGEPRS
jgi:uncharacterized protein YcfJ